MIIIILIVLISLFILALINFLIKAKIIKLDTLKVKLESINFELPSPHKLFPLLFGLVAIYIATKMWGVIVEETGSIANVTTMSGTPVATVLKSMQPLMWLVMLAAVFTFVFVSFAEEKRKRLY